MYWYVYEIPRPMEVSADSASGKDSPSTSGTTARPDGPVDMVRQNTKPSGTPPPPPIGSGY